MSLLYGYHQVTLRLPSDPISETLNGPTAPCVPSFAPVKRAWTLHTFPWAFSPIFGVQGYMTLNPKLKTLNPNP